MYARVFKFGSHRRKPILQASYKYFNTSNHDRNLSQGSSVYNNTSGFGRHYELRFFGSDSGGGDGNKGGVKQNTSLSEAYTRLAEEDQKEWLHNKLLTAAIKSKQVPPFVSKKERFKKEFLRRILPWEQIAVSLDTFPYYINENSKKLLLECAASHLKHKDVTGSYGNRLASSSGRIRLQSIPGTELYRERLVKALARELQVPLLVLDSSVLAPFDFSKDESELDEPAEECSSQSDAEEDNDASNEDEIASSNGGKQKILRAFIPFSSEEFAKIMSGESILRSVTVQSPKHAKRPLRKGDRVKYIGDSMIIEDDKRPLPTGQCGEVYQVNGGRVAVVLDSTSHEEADEAAEPSVYWIPSEHIEHDPEDCNIAIDTLHEVLSSSEPLIVYFPDSSQWLSRAVPKSNCDEFVQKVEQMFEQLSPPIVLICGENKVETGSKEKEKFTMVLPNFGRLALPLSLKSLTAEMEATKRPEYEDLSKLFTNVLCVHSPKEDELLRVFSKQVEEDRKIMISRSNLDELYKALEDHELSCTDLLHVKSDDVNLTKQKAEKVIGWARNHYLSTCDCPCVEGARLNLPRESLEVALSRLKEQEMSTKKSSQNLKSFAKDEYESNFVSAVVPADEIGVRFDDIGALEEVKKTLNELVTLPMRRPELFSHGNLLRPCKGILLFGPPGTGKTLLAKALATEAGANFISITGSTLTSKWFGDAEKLTKALFSFASKLAPVIIFVDEVDSLLGARGGANEHEATRRMRNEFMAAWDGLRTKDSQRILILGATNRPFDLDDAVIRRLPRRIYIDLPDAGNRMKILTIFLAQENLEPGFKFDELAKTTEGYSGSDLKNLCIAAAYRPVQELLEEEKKSGANNPSQILRSLKLEDFIEAKAKVGASVAYDATSMNELRKWNEQYGEGGSRSKSPFGIDLD
ncbi:hypothetical protein C5167_017647 [Papaver somniferum]|uniref:AAA+ ATPase domain-containing protein n=1 Tax=Papaver somniferum TaxID=3469 RepID=A0A4Y7INA6_PAPSO|nr:uncharacterized protein LOC113350870 [Papaver somniferum]RZC49221.1 hypothetical protein C5167_017647 [Papaver somniferum]